ncbi:MAG: hypothetical protein L0229_26175 [Blastocatellia bacterium]|nr:hypothetical protein [Blastocatellia bacterium]
MANIEADVKRLALVFLVLLPFAVTFWVESGKSAEAGTYYASRVQSPGQQACVPYTVEVAGPFFNGSNCPNDRIGTVVKREIYRIHFDRVSSGGNVDTLVVFKEVWGQGPCYPAGGAALQVL